MRDRGGNIIDVNKKRGGLITEPWGTSEITGRLLSVAEVVEQPFQNVWVQLHTMKFV